MKDIRTRAQLSFNKPEYLLKYTFAKQPDLHH